MWCCDGTWGWWWLVLLIGIVLCMVMCLRMRSKMPGRRFCCRGGAGAADIDEMKNEMKELREEVGSIKKSEGDKDGR